MNLEQLRRKRKVKKIKQSIATARTKNKDPYSAAWGGLVDDRLFRLYAREIALNSLQNRITNFVTMLRLDGFKADYSGPNVFGDHNIHVYDSRDKYYLVYISKTTVEVHDVNINILFKSKSVNETFNWFLENIES